MMVVMILRLVMLPTTLTLGFCILDLRRWWGGISRPETHVNVLLGQREIEVKPVLASPCQDPFSPSNQRAMRQEFDGPSSRWSRSIICKVSNIFTINIVYREIQLLILGMKARHVDFLLPQGSCKRRVRVIGLYMPAICSSILPPSCTISPIAYPTSQTLLGWWTPPVSQMHVSFCHFVVGHPTGEHHALLPTKEL